jgi:hypothetical protein
MKPATGRPLSCHACHDPHRLDTARAAVAGCLECHADTHSRAFVQSPHARLASRPASASGESVTCATCHMPRVRRGDRVAVHHGNTFTLRPRDRMATAVCTRCHGLPFSLASLADDRLVANNFNGRPAAGLRTFEMARTARGTSPRSEPEARP